MSSAQAMFVALLGRPADPAGLAYFNELTKGGTDYTQISGITQIPEFRVQFWGQEFDYDGAYVDAYYLTMFGRHADAGGLGYFTNLITPAFVGDNLPRLGIAIMEAAQNEDKLNLDAKIAVAERFTARLDTATEIAGYGGSEADRARDFLAAVDHNHIPSDQDIDAFIIRMTSSHFETVGVAAISAELS